MPSQSTCVTGNGTLRGKLLKKKRKTKRKEREVEANEDEDMNDQPKTKKIDYNVLGHLR